MTDIDAAGVIELAAQLVRLRTVNKLGATVVERPAADVVADVMRGFGWPVTVSEVAPGRPNVVAVIEGSGRGRTLMFEGHTDVVTEGDPSRWSFDPFGGDVVAGQLRGRGSADMKSGVAAMIHAARAVEQDGFRGRIVVGVLADEEGMMLGAKHFAASDVARSGIDGVIVCEPEGGEVCATAKGALRLRVDIDGVMAHGAMPQIGRNPIPALGSLLVGVGELERQIAASVGPHPELGDFYLTPTVLTAGSAEQANVIPSTATVHLDARTIPAVDHGGLIHLVTRLAEQIAAESDLTATVTVIDDRPPVDTPRDELVVTALVAAHREVTGADAVYGGVPGTTDGTILTRDAGLATVVYGPGGKWIAHQADEVVAVDDVVTCARVYAAAARRFLDAP
jgi:succinyl-diaminopimelate desuccinylase